MFSSQPELVSSHPLVAWVCHRAMMACLVLLALLAWSGVATAQQVPSCWFENSNGHAINAPPVQISTITPITVALPSPHAGADIGSPLSATTSTGTIYIACDRSTANPIISPNATYENDYTYYSTAPGVAYQILRSGNPPDTSPIGKGQVITFSNTTAFQLVSTGVLPSSGTVIPAGTVLGQWQIASICTGNPNTNRQGDRLESCGTSATNYTFIIFESGGVTFTAHTCKVTTGSQNIQVPLPSIPVTALGSTGATAGATSFQIHLDDCYNGLTVSAEIDTNAPFTGATGVITPTAGTNFAQNVGVQLLAGNGTTPVTFGTPFNVGTTSGNNSQFTFNLFARYYRTGTPITAGQVEATATYTLSYQ
ncbi:MAG TPA: fimbrial protein [Rhodanobacteraceae bacterium]